MQPVDPKWIRGPADEQAIKEGCYFDEEAAERVCKFVEGYCRQSKGRWSGERLQLLDWQRDFLKRLFGWKRPDGLRRYRRAYLEVAKKNGKSTLISAVALYLALADFEGAPEVYINACDREQASIIYDEASRMVKASPGLLKRAEVIDSKKRIVFPSSNGKIVANSAEVANKDGINASGVIFDELHRQPDRLLWDIFEYAGASRDQPLTISITTAGEDAEGVWHEQREHAEAVNAGTVPDTRFLGVVYRALETDDLDDPATWRKANPSLGITISEEDFKNELEEAKRVPVKLANFKRLRLNIISRGEGKFVRPEIWILNAGEQPPIRRAEPLWMGLDLSTTTDLTALATINRGHTGVIGVRMNFWLPEDDIVELERRHGVPYRAWADAGYITLTPGNVIDYDYIRSDINDFSLQGSIKQINVDPYNATKLAIELKEEDGLPVEFMRQGFLSLSGPTKELERLLLGSRLRHGGNPVLKWMAGNAVAENDAAANIKLSRKKSKKKIDGMAALVNAIAAMLGPESEEGGDSVYESRGILFI